MVPMRKNEDAGEGREGRVSEWLVSRRIRRRRDSRKGRGELRKGKSLEQRRGGPGGRGPVRKKKNTGKQGIITEKSSGSPKKKKR